jgi:cytochrome c oxidase subunit 2
MVGRKFLAMLLGLWATLATTGARAQEGASYPWQMNFRDAATPSMDAIVALHDGLLILITVIALFVLVLMSYVMVRFRASRNPTPSKTTHNTLIEVVWTVVPIVILVGLAIPSFRLLYFLDRTTSPDMTFKAIGHQWYWSYEYSDHGGFSFDAVMIETDKLKPGQLRLLATDNEIVLPTEQNIRVLVTADDVIHAWSIPAFGVKVDAVPGRINETWMRITRPGIYYGQCSELCGIRHGFMPIQVRAVPKAEFDQWAVRQKAAFDALKNGSTQVAAAAEQR